MNKYIENPKTNYEQAPITKTEITKFWGLVNVGLPNECWFWSGGKTSAGYGQFYAKGIQYYTHRLGWQLSYGLIPKKVCVCHHCDNPACCNPRHLFLGSQADNIKDAVSKGKFPAGEQQPLSKLTWDDVREIRRLYKPYKYSQRSLARQFGVSQPAIWNIIHNILWRAPSS